MTTDGTYDPAEDELYPSAVALVREDNKASISFVQRRLQIGYNRAARLLDLMERLGVVSAQDRLSGARTVISPFTPMPMEPEVPTTTTTTTAGEPAPTRYHSMNGKTPKNIVELVDDLDGGVFGQKIEHALHSVAEGVIATGRAGKVTLTFDLKQIANSNQVAMKHKLAFIRPTNNGKTAEENTTETPLYVGVRGKLTLFPESQPDMFKRENAE
jgi:hypothetical protein